MATFDVYSLIYHYLIIISPYDISVNVIYCIHVTVPPGNTGCRVTVKFTLKFQIKALCGIRAPPGKILKIK